MWHHGEGRLLRVDRRVHDIRSFHTVRRCDQLQVESFEGLLLYVQLAAPHQTGSRKIQSARASHEAVRRNSLIHGLLKNESTVMWLIVWLHVICYMLQHCFLSIKPSS